MHEISPVLAETFDRPDYAPARVNINGGAETADVSAPKATTDAGTADFSFSDFLDLINPLQHIPVVSSIYREVTGDSINPVSRVAGDILYGGALGFASAMISGIGAAADSVVEAETGKDTVGNVVAALFGDDKEITQPSDQQTQLAAAPMPPAAVEATVVSETTSAPPAPTAKSTPANTPDISTDKEQAVAAASAPPAMTSTSPTATTGTTTTIPLAAATNKLPYGGVMAPVGNSAQQNMALALSSSGNTMRIGNRIYTNPGVVGNRGSVPNMVGQATAPAHNALLSALTGMGAKKNDVTSSSYLPSMGVTNDLPQALSDNMAYMKAISQYRSVAGGSSPASAGTSVNTLN